MKYNLNYIIYKQLMRYLSEDEKQSFRDEFSKHSITKGTIVKFVLKHFEIERLKNAPLIWQDIWIYNYLKYDKVLHNKHLISKYEKEVFIDDDSEFFARRDYLNSLELVNKLKDPLK